jgi:multiple sugar transport system substrate-binding protein
MKNYLFKLLGMLILASVLMSACGAGAAPATQAPAEKAKVVIFVGFGTGTDPDQVAAQDALAKSSTIHIPTSRWNS